MENEHQFSLDLHHERPNKTLVQKNPFLKISADA